MRPLLLKCLVVLVSLALVGGNAHADLTLDPSDPCLGGHEHSHAHAADEAGHSPLHHDKTHHDDGCCCQCLGCTTAMDVMPNLALVPKTEARRVRFEQRTPTLGTRALDPGLDPPRPGALI